MAARDKCAFSNSRMRSSNCLIETGFVSPEAIDEGTVRVISLPKAVDVKSVTEARGTTCGTHYQQKYTPV